MDDVQINTPDADENLPKTRYSGAYWMEEFRLKNLEFRQYKEQSDNTDARNIELQEANERLRERLAIWESGSPSKSQKGERRIRWEEALHFGILASLFLPKDK